MTLSDVSNVAERAKQSLGGSSDPVYQMVAKALNQLNSGGVLVDVGCGKLWSFVGNYFDFLLFSNDARNWSLYCLVSILPLH